MMKFRKKPVVIDAIQWTGENLQEVIDFTGKHERFSEWFKSFADYEAHVKADRNVFKIFTLEGVMDATPGDWIIRGVKGEHYPCKADIFAATYEPADQECEINLTAELARVKAKLAEAATLIDHLGGSSKFIREVMG